MTTLEERVIDLHQIAREIETQIGNGKLSQGIRASADTLNELIKQMASEETHNER